MSSLPLSAMDSSPTSTQSQPSSSSASVSSTPSQSQPNPAPARKRPLVLLLPRISLFPLSPVLSQNLQEQSLTRPPHQQSKRSALPLLSKSSSSEPQDRVNPPHRPHKPSATTERQPRRFNLLQIPPPTMTKIYRWMRWIELMRKSTKMHFRGSRRVMIS